MLHLQEIINIRKSNIFVLLGWKDTEKRDKNTTLGTILTKTPPYVIRNMLSFAGVQEVFKKNMSTNTLFLLTIKAV